MFTITSDTLWGLCFSSDTPDSMAVEASSLGWAPGEWPERIIVTGEKPFVYVRQSRVDEFGTRTYTSRDKLNLRVLND